MEQVQQNLPERPRGFEDYIAAARKVIEYAVYSPQPDPAYLSASTYDAYPDTIDCLDEVVAEYQQKPALPEQLLYNFAYRLFMEDAVANTRNGYEGIRSLSTSILQAEAIQATHTSETTQLVASIERTMAEISETLVTEYCAGAMDRAERIIDRDNGLKRFYRKVLLSLALIDDDEDKLSEDWHGLSEVELRWKLRDLAVIRAKLLADAQRAAEHTGPSKAGGPVSDIIQ